MSLLKNLKKDENIAGETDVIGGSFVLDSGIYLSTVTMAYLLPSPKGALGLVLHFKTEDGKEFRQTLYVTSGDDKGNKNTYTRNGKEHYLPGYNLANSLCLLTVGQELPDMETEMKVVKAYSKDAGEEVPTEVEVLTELLNEDVYVALQKQIQDRSVQGDDGKYHPTGETREVNEIDKFFRASDKLTTAEILAESSEPAFFAQWEERWKGQVRDRTTGTSAAKGAPKIGGARSADGGEAQKPPRQLFQKK